jgi:peroxiredoxin
MTAILFGTVLPWLLIGVGTWLGFQLVRQNGRLLVRLESIENRLPARAGKKQPDAGGLPIGTLVPDFELPDLAGVGYKLSEFRDMNVLLIFFNPNCGFCTKMAPDLALLPAEGDADRAVPIVVTTGDAEENRKLVEKYGIRCVVLLQKEMEVASRFHAQGTPMGYRIDGAGRIASELTVGAEPLLKLAVGAVGRGSPDPSHMIDRRSPGHAHEGDLRSGDSAWSETRAERGPDASANGSAHHGAKVYRSVATSRLNRKGLKAGAPAPDFRLPRLDGGELSLADLRGGRVLLVFSDPHCGPCEELAPRLQEIHSQQTDLQVLMIGRGEFEDNRAKAAALGLSFPIVIQQKWEVSLLYAMFATPIGYLIDEQGILLSDVAVGVEPILALADEPAVVGVPASAGAALSGKEASWAN